MRTDWMIGTALLAAGIVLVSIAMVGMGLNLFWAGFESRPGAPGRPWWLWLLFLAPPVLMVTAGLAVRRSGASLPVALGATGIVGAVSGLAYLVSAYLVGR